MLLRDISKVDLSATVLGRRCQIPILTGPAGGHATAHPDGEKAIARAAATYGTVSTLLSSTDSGLSCIQRNALPGTGSLPFTNKDLQVCGVGQRAKFKLSDIHAAAAEVAAANEFGLPMLWWQLYIPKCATSSKMDRCELVLMYSQQFVLISHSVTAVP